MNNYTDRTRITITSLRSHVILPLSEPRWHWLKQESNNDTHNVEIIKTPESFQKSQSGKLTVFVMKCISNLASNPVKPTILKSMPSSQVQSQVTCLNRVVFEPTRSVPNFDWCSPHTRQIWTSYVLPIASYMSKSHFSTFWSDPAYFSTVGSVLSCPPDMNCVSSSIRMLLASGKQLALLLSH